MGSHIPDEEKIERVFEALTEHGEQTLAELVVNSRMSAAQARGGWQGVRRLFGALAVMEHHGPSGATYRLSNDVRDGGIYELWQARHLLTRGYSWLNTARQVADVATSDAARGQYYAVVAGIHESLAPMRARIRTLATELGYAPEVIEVWVAERPMLNGAAS